MNNVILYIASSLDGYIADKNGGVKWLEPYDEEDYGYEQFISTVEYLIMGSKTYEQVVSFGKWPYQGKKTIVVSKRQLEVPDDVDVEITSQALPALIKELKGKSAKNIWLTGGSNLITQFMKEGLVDQIWLYLIPTLVHEGIPLFTGIHKNPQFHLVSAMSFDNGVVELKYNIRET